MCPYDLTSTYFEGDVPLNGKAKRGYSRDKRPDLPRRAGGSAGCKQAVVGLVVNRDGFPLAHEVFEGNTVDSTTVGWMLDILADRVGLAPGATVVIDRGMAGAARRDRCSTAVTSWKPQATTCRPTTLGESTRC